MQTINLTDPSKSSLIYEVIQFPDGQRHIKFLSEINRKERDTRVLCRICNAEDLFLLVQVLDVFNRHGLVPKVAISYLMGARMDRIMSFNEPFTLQIIGNILNCYKAEIYVLEPHNEDAVKRLGWVPVFFPWNIFGIICFPDEGAFFRYRDYWGGNSSVSMIICKKKRDPLTGKLSGFGINCLDKEIEGKDVMVVDDLIDGGGTFCGIAPLIREKHPRRLQLFVCHAVQLEGIKRVADIYDGVSVTDSYRDWTKDNIPDNVNISSIDEFFINCISILS